MGAEVSFEEYLEAVEAGARRLADVASERPEEVPIPTCPEWSCADLLAHLGGVFEFFSARVAAADQSEPHEPERSIPASGQLVNWLERRAAALVESLRADGPSARCWNWSGRDLTTAWVARRMALETAVHCYDGEVTAGDPKPVATALAIDGLDERINVHLATDVPEEPGAALGGSLCLACSDADCAFVVEVGHGRLHVHEGAGPASAFVRGPASDIFLFSWNRVPLECLDVTGDRDVAAAWASLPV